ncbi:MAG: 50S ribosomal protein L13 [Planctomycetota bacterium]
MTKTTLSTAADRRAAMNEWRLVDATGQVLGRMAAEIAQILMGKHRPQYTPHMLVGEGVVVIHADKVKLTGNKRATKEHLYYTGHPGGLRRVKLGQHVETKPEEVVRLAVRRMLPKNRLAKRMLSRLKVYAGGEHPHVAQKPKETKLSGR